MWLEDLFKSATNAVKIFIEPTLINCEWSNLFARRTRIETLVFGVSVCTVHIHLPFIVTPLSVRLSSALAIRFLLAASSSLSSAMMPIEVHFEAHRTSSNNHTINRQLSDHFDPVTHATPHSTLVTAKVAFAKISLTVPTSRVLSVFS